MRGAIALLIATLTLISCSQPPSAASASASPIAHTSPTPPAGATAVAMTNPDSIPKLTGAYGLLYSRPSAVAPGILHLVKADATLGASVPMEWDDFSVLCASTTDTVNSLPPVSASNGHVYLRDGATIRMVVPPSSKVDVTTVPQGVTLISFFSVSPDDKKIAVVALDTSSGSTLKTRLYVEDLVGGGHHADIYSASSPKGPNAQTLWPMGWHQGNLVLAVVPACTSGLSRPPTEWHVSSAVTATRVATVKDADCLMSMWPSPAGVACATAAGRTALYNWQGKTIGTAGPGIQTEVLDTGLSPAGQSIFFLGSISRAVQLGPGPYATLDHAPCAWIDEDHLLSTDAVTRFPAETPGNVQVTADVTSLPQKALPDPSTPLSSRCAGRFPGGL